MQVPVVIHFLKLKLIEITGTLYTYLPISRVAGEGVHVHAQQYPYMYMYSLHDIV